MRSPGTWLPPRDKAHLSAEELQELARQQEIPGRSKMDREELVATVAPR